ncbi:MAG: NADPH:quinone oxidoreductase family protein [Rhodospirillaceae bacterium]|nr:NADPH:quinone oxidoreductase family protein [Rhodospirillaceae bacterium]MYB12159.1 NADPH:quinone oxidoreductase family protein [Rhodospirillaceae bacterium]MYI49942.1 NADPH:quinone oxidoreductase family protein [Rhodospirillaceae bacterium]
MRAVVCERLSEDFSGTAIRDVALPEPGPGDVLVQVRAAGIGFPDLLMCRGGYQLKPPLPFTPGMDVSGTVAAVGPGVTAFGPGDAVAGAARFGSFAGFVSVPGGQLRPKPPNLSDTAAAACQVACLTAYVALVRRAALQPGETLLVHGASGGAGMAAIGLGRALGARIVATTGSPAKAAALEAAGADHVLEVGEGFREPVKELTDGRGADVIFDPVGGGLFDESVRCIAFGGRLLVIGFAAGRIAEIATNMPLIKGFSVVGVRAGEYGRRFPDRGRENLDAVWKLAAEGKVTVPVHAELPLEDFRAGFAMLERREAVGKVVLTVS